MVTLTGPDSCLSIYVETDRGERLSMFLNVCLGSDLHAKLARVFMSMCVFFTHVWRSSKSMNEHFVG